MDRRFLRTAMLIGDRSLSHLIQSSVIVCGLGGVGSYLAESLARSGVGRLRLVDFDTVDITNLNRQLPGLTSTLGRFKTEVVAQRLLDINPHIQVESLSVRIAEDNIDKILEGTWDYLGDAIDDVEAKVMLIKACLSRGVPVISSMGAGNKLDPTLVEVADISKTHGCPLAKAVRHRLRQEGISSKVKAVFSPEKPPRTKAVGPTPASMAFVPGTFGLTMGAEIVKDLIDYQKLLEG